MCCNADFRALDHQFAERSQCHRPRLAVKQRLAQLRLQRLNALRERGLRDIQRRRSPPEMRVTDEHRQMTKASLDNRDKQTMIKSAEFTVAGTDTLCSNKSAMRALSPER